MCGVWAYWNVLFTLNVSDLNQPHYAKVIQKRPGTMQNLSMETGTTRTMKTQIHKGKTQVKHIQDGTENQGTRERRGSKAHRNTQGHRYFKTKQETPKSSTPSVSLHRYVHWLTNLWSDFSSPPLVCVTSICYALHSCLFYLFRGYRLNLERELSALLPSQHGILYSPNWNFLKLLHLESSILSSVWDRQCDTIEQCLRFKC